jgi:hypothetical protein
MRTDDQIVDLVHKLTEGDEDFFGNIRADLVLYLPLDRAREFFKGALTEAEEAQWKATPRDRDSVIAEILDYMPFAWGKANDCRGLSAARSLDHMRAWLWMLEEDEACKACEDYDHYGKPQLRTICEKFGWDWKQWDDGLWRNDESGPFKKPNDVPKVVINWKN